MLNSDVLISPILSLDSLNIAGEDKSFNYYIHRDSGQVQVGVGTNYQQNIISLSPPSHLLNHISDQLNRITASVDLSFVEVNDPAIADFSVYYDTEIDINDTSSLVFGLTMFNNSFSPRRQWIEIFLHGTSLNFSSTDLQYYVFNHELLHALGLEHTFDDTDGDFYLSTDPQLSATTDQTVMSYRPPVSGIYPTDLTPSDYNALIDIWGAASNPAYTNSQPQHIYRLYNKFSGNHLFTSNLNEIDVLTGSSSDSTFISEGIAYEVGPNPDTDLHRFYHLASDRHFYSATIYERDLLINDPSGQYLYEGVAFKVFTSNNSSYSRIPVQRYYDPSQHIHFYSASLQEQSIWDQDHPHWINEGAAWFA